MARILVVDDERDVVSLLRFLLEKDGHEVLEAYNGAEALETLGISPASNGPDPAPGTFPALPDLVILDVVMPVMDGYSTTEALAADPRTRSIPVLILTAKNEMKALCQEAPNIAAYVEKPFDPRKLRELVASLFPAR